tara:strand:- start:2701 stop:3402 length:702 start_codon:yes stop_codon:yes gene_type:complete
MNDQTSKSSKNTQRTANVQLDDAAFDAAVEDPILLFWKRYRGPIQSVVILALLATVAFLGYTTFKKRSLAKIQDAYLMAAENDTLDAFAESHDNSPLAGIILLKDADKAYTHGEFSKAMQAYGQASEALKDKPLRGRAQLGHAMSAIQLGDETSGMHELTALAKEANAPDVLRAEAAYQNAILCLRNGDDTQAKSMIELIKALPGSGFWGQKASLLSETVPQLRDSASPSVVE